MAKLKRHLLLALILLLATALRLYTIFHVGDFIWDEMFSFTYSQKPWMDSIRFWLWETNPPLHLALLKLWWHVFPANELFARLPSLIFGVLTVAGIYAAGRNLFNEKVGLIAALLLALTPYHLLLSALGRGYALLLLLATISIMYFFKVFIRGEDASPPLFPTLILSLANVLLLFTHLTAVLLIAAETAVVRIHDKKRFKDWLWCCAPLIAPGAWIAASFIAKRFNPQIVGSSWFFNMRPTFAEGFAPFKLLFFGPNYHWWSALVMALFLFGLLYTLFRQRRLNTISASFLYLIIFVLIPLLTALALRLWNIKFFIIALPPLVLVAAYLLNMYVRPSALSALAAFLLTIPGLYFFHGFLPFNDWSIPNQYVQARYNPRKKQLFVYNDFIEKLLVDRYYTAPLPSLYYLHNDTSAGWDQLVITTNYLQYPHPLSEIRAWYAARRLDEYDEIVLLYTPRLQIDIPKILEEKGWRKRETSFSLPMRDSRIMYYYVK